MTLIEVPWGVQAAGSGQDSPSNSQSTPQKKKKKKRKNHAGQGSDLRQGAAAALPAESPALKEPEVNADNGGTEFGATAADVQTPVGAQG